MLRGESTHRLRIDAIPWTCAFLYATLTPHALQADTQLRTTSQTGSSANLLNRTEILNGLAAALFPRHRHVFSESQRFCVKTPSGATSSIEPPATHPEHLSACLLYTSDAADE